MFYTYGYLFYIPVTVISVIFFGIKGFMHKRPLAYYIFAILAVFYINKAVDLTTFPMLLEKIPDFHVKNNINLELILDYRSLYHLFGNIILTFPIGFGIQYLFDLKLPGKLIASILLSISFELVQLVLLLTITPINMIFDINDIIYNVIGAVFGVIISILFNKVISLFSVKTERHDIFTYIYKVCLNCSQNKSSLNNVHYLYLGKH